METGISAICLSFELFIAFKYWERLTASLVYGLWILGSSIVITWVKVLQDHQKIREHFWDLKADEIENGSDLDILLDAAASTIHSSLAYTSTGIGVFLLMLTRLLAHLG